MFTWKFFRCLLALYLISTTAVAYDDTSTVLYSNQDLVIRRGVHIQGGAAGSQGGISIGAAGGLPSNTTLVESHLFALADLTLRKGSVVTGDVLVGGKVFIREGSQIHGTITQGALNVPVLSIPTQTVLPGTQNIQVKNNGSLTLPSGRYRNIQVGNNAVLTLSGGDYHANNFALNNGASLVIAGATNLIVQTRVAILKDATVTLVGESITPAHFQLFSNASNNLIIGRDAVIAGMVYAAQASLLTQPGADLTGVFMANQITIGQNTKVTFYPPLSDEPQGPINTSLVIDQGAYTNEGTIHLTLSADHAGEMILSFDYDFSGAAYEPFATEAIMNLTQGDGHYTVHVKFRGSGIESDVLTASITRDTVPPVLEILAPDHGMTVTGRESP